VAAARRRAPASTAWQSPSGRSRRRRAWRRCSRCSPRGSYSPPPPRRASCFPQVRLRRNCIVLALRLFPTHGIVQISLCLLAVSVRAHKFSPGRPPGGADTSPAAKRKPLLVQFHSPFLFSASVLFFLVKLQLCSGYAILSPLPSAKEKKKT
jgi:hypothetical protein